MLIYSSFKESEKLLKSIIDDDRNFSIEILKEIVETCKESNIIYES